MHTAYIGIGSNLGDRQKNCLEAVRLVGENSKVKVVAVSSWRETSPLAEIQNPRSKIPMYVNGAIKIETDLGPEELLVFLQEAEQKLGRIRTGRKWEARTMDLDILFYDDLLIDTPTLKMPHPELHKRMFVLEPLCDIEPEFVHPVLGMSIRQLKEKL